MASDGSVVVYFPHDYDRGNILVVNNVDTVVVNYTTIWLQVYNGLVCITDNKTTKLDWYSSPYNPCEIDVLSSWLKQILTISSGSIR